MADRVPLDPAVLELPERIRVHALAKRLGVTSRQILAELAHLGAEARSPQSNVERATAQQVIAAVAAEPELALERPSLPEPESEPANSAETETTAALFATAIPEQPPVTEPVVFDSAVETPLFLPPETTAPDTGRRRRRVVSRTTETVETSVSTVSEEDSDTESGEGGPRRRRRGRRGRGRGRGGETTDSSADTDASKTTGAALEATTDQPEAADTSGADASDEDAEGGSNRRRRRRRRRKVGGEGAAVEVASGDDPPNTVVHEREPRTKSRARRGDEVQGIVGSTRLAAKRQRRRDGRDAGRRRPPILTESEFLARREAVDRLMVVREKPIPGHPDATQVAVLEDKILVEHFVTNTGDSGSLVGNVYLGRVQNVLPSMEAAFVDIGRGRNGVLYAGEVDWEAAGLGGRERKIEQALKPGDQVVVQVSKDPVGHKGARLTTQISIAGRFLVYVPGGSSMGISRKLPDTERRRLKEILHEVMPEDAGVIIRTAAEGVSAAELTRDVERLQAAWQSIQTAAAQGVTGPATLYEEPDLLVKVVRDLFNEDFSGLIIEGDRAADTVENYIRTVAPDLLARVSRHDKGPLDVFQVHRIDEQLAKALDRKVWLPSGGTLVIDRTEAMTVIDVNTGKFTGSGGGNLEETVTRNNLEAAEEIVRQMRLRDIGGMIVVDFIDMVLESNQELVLRRLTEALGRDRTRHQVSEVTSLGLVQMTRKRLGTGLLEAFSTACEHCHGRGVVVHHDPVHTGSPEPEELPTRREPTGRRRRGRTRVAAPTRVSEVVPESVHEDAAAKRAHPVALAMAAHQAEQHGEAEGHGEGESPGNSDNTGPDSGHGDASHNGVVRTSGSPTENIRPEPSEREIPEQSLAASQDSRPAAAPRRRRAARTTPIAPANQGTAAVFVLSPGETSHGPDFDAQLPETPPVSARRPRRRSVERPAGPPPPDVEETTP